MEAEKTRFFARVIERRGAHYGHQLGRWFEAQLVFEHELPPGVPQAVKDGEAKLMVRCVKCGAWAAILTEDGATGNAPEFDMACRPSNSGSSPSAA